MFSKCNLNVSLTFSVFLCPCKSNLNCLVSEWCHINKTALLFLAQVQHGLPLRHEVGQWISELPCNGELEGQKLEEPILAYELWCSIYFN